MLPLGKRGESIRGDLIEEFRALQSLIPDPRLPTAPRRRPPASSDYAVIGTLTGFALLALVLAATGLFGVISYGVAQRTAEFGTRMALGASAGDVIGLVARQSARLLLLGVATGLTLGVGAGFAMGGVLNGLSPLDPLSIGSVIALLVTVTLVATALPAWRASRIDPVVALRAE